MRAHFNLAQFLFLLTVIVGCGKNSPQSQWNAIPGGNTTSPNPAIPNPSASTAPISPSVQAKEDCKGGGPPRRLPQDTIELLAAKGVRVDPLNTGFDGKEGYPVLFGDKAFAQDGTILPEIAELLKPGGTYQEFAFGELLSDAGLAQLNKLPPVRKISLHKLSRITDDGLAGMRINDIRRLSLSELDIKDKALANVKTYPELEDVSIDECPHITDAVFTHLKEVPKLKRLLYYPFKIGGPYNLTDSTLQKIAELSSLEELIFPPEGPNQPRKDGYKFTDRGLEHLSRLKKLKKVHLPWCNNITASGVAHIAALTDLEELGLPFCEKVDDNALAGLKNCPKLRLLDLSGNQITDAGLVHLKSLAQLEFLALDWTMIGDAGLKHLTPLRQLSSIHVHRTKVTKEGIAEFNKANPKPFVSD